MTTRGIREPRPCNVRTPDPDPITGEIKPLRCDRPVRGAHPVCPDHWRPVPAGLKITLAEQWRHFDLTGEGWDDYDATRHAVLVAAEDAAWAEYGGRPDA